MKCNLFRHGCKIWKHVETYQKVAAGSVILQGITMAACEYSKIRKTRKSILRNLEVSPVNCFRNWKNLRTPKTVPPFNPSLSSDGLSSSHTNSATNNRDQLLRSVALGKISWLASICVFIVSQKGHTKNGWYKNHQKSRLYTFFRRCIFPLFLYIQDINHRFQAKIHFRSNFIPPVFLSKRRFFPVSQTLSCRDIK